MAHRNEAVVVKGGLTRRCRWARSASHTEGEKRNENALWLGCDALVD